MTSITPTPQTWTLRFKHRKTTVLLHTDPLQTFASIKENLYNAIAESSITDPTTLEPVPLPSSPADIQLGRPIDRSDPALGFMLGEWEVTPIDTDEDVEVSGKGKGKAKATATATAKGKEKARKSDGAANVKDCPKGAGIKDRDVLAFRWRGDGTGWEEEEDKDIMEDGERDGDMWGVKLATFEDGYGVENEMDLGGKAEFEG